MTHAAKPYPCTTNSRMAGREKATRDRYQIVMGTRGGRKFGLLLATLTHSPFGSRAEFGFFRLAAGRAV
jgi:hypothetical protein